MWHTQTDYAVSNPISNLSVVRTYTSNSMHIDASVAYAFGVGWTFPYDVVLKPSYLPPAGTKNFRCYSRLDITKLFCETEPPGTALTLDTTPGAVTVARGRGRTNIFTRSGSEWIAEPDVRDRLLANYSADNTHVVSWEYTASNSDSVEVFDRTGRLVSIRSRAGATRLLTYSSGTDNDTSASRVPADAPVCTHVQQGAVLPAGRLLCVTDPVGRQIQFEYNLGGQVSKLIDAAGRETLYEYDGPSGGCLTPGDTTKLPCTAKNLTKVTYPDNTSRTYWYNEASHLKNSAGAPCAISYAAGNGFGHLFNAMTGLIDENNQRHISWTYQCDGKATSSEVGDGKEKVAIGYDTPAIGARTVTHYTGTAANPVATSTVMAYSSVQSVPSRTGTTLPCPECGAMKARSYDVNGNVASVTDWNGNISNYTYDTSRNLETSRTEAVGTVQSRTTTTEWHPRYNLPVGIATALRLTTYQYDPAGVSGQPSHL